MLPNKPAPDVDPGLGPAFGQDHAPPRGLLRGAATALLALALDGGAHAQLLDCRGGQHPTQVAQLMFGRNIGSRQGVSETKWGRFLDREIVPRFTDGLTVFDATGRWRNRTSNAIVRERSKIVEIVLPGTPEDITRLNEIVETYKRRFKQQSVGLIVRPACVSF
jgi:hypothetical protein